MKVNRRGFLKACAIGASSIFLHNVPTWANGRSHDISLPFSTESKSPPDFIFYQDLSENDHEDDHDMGGPPDYFPPALPNVFTNEEKLISEIDKYIENHRRLPNIDIYYRFSGVASSPDPQHWSRIESIFLGLLAADASSGKQRVQNPKPIIAPLYPQAAPYGASAHGTSPPPPLPIDLPPEFDALKDQNGRIKERPFFSVEKFGMKVQMRAGHHPVSNCVPETYVFHLNFEYAREKKKKKGRWNHLLNAHLGVFRDTQVPAKLCYMLYVTRDGRQPICRRTCEVNDDDGDQKLKELLTQTVLIAMWTIGIAASTAALRKYALGASRAGNIAHAVARRALGLPRAYQNATTFGLSP